jgi:hypothetical protein
MPMATAMTMSKNICDLFMVYRNYTANLDTNA